MEITYIFHSAFAIETSRCIIVFDFWMDPAGVSTRFLKTDKPIYVFASHFHQDHFSKSILEWKKQRNDITYIFSKDILKRRRAKDSDADIWMVKGSVWEDSNIKVTATGSNDSGVSWIVETEGKVIFHAGDLNNWYARFLSDRNNIPSTIISEELEEIDPQKEEKLFLGELKDIAKISTYFDIVMFPIDGRIGNGYTLGGRQFIERFKVGLFVPMHFVCSGFESSWRMKEFCVEKKIQFWSIREEGECLPL